MICPAIPVLHKHGDERWPNLARPVTAYALVFSLAEKTPNSGTDESSLLADADKVRDEAQRLKAGDTA